jgi:hypothetical protein
MFRNVSCVLSAKASWLFPIQVGVALIADYLAVELVWTLWLEVHSEICGKRCARLLFRLLATALLARARVLSRYLVYVVR